MELAGRPPKTEAGRRTVSIPPQIMARLERHLRSFVGADGSLPVLTGRKGGRLGRHPLNAAWQTARRQLGRPEIHFHDLRGAGLTWAATQGATTHELMARAGHASAAAAVRYQDAAEDRDVVISEALSGLAASAEEASASSAGYSRDDDNAASGRSAATTPMGCTSVESGRPGSNWHHQLGRLRFYH
jgi:hypothetical protein